jgi:hypothetical protein
VFFLQLHSCKNQTLLRRWNPLVPLDYLLEVRDRILWGLTWLASNIERKIGHRALK